jgi:penicillin amidase
MPSKTRKTLVTLLVALAVGFVIVGAAMAGGLWLAVRASLPKIGGQLTVKGLNATVKIERDGQGVPTIHADDRADLAFGLGFVHGQDRFFQMDSLRRYAAGELAEMLGPGPDGLCIAWDRQIRVQRFRSVASQVVAGSAENARRELDAYVAGVNAGLGSLRVLPFEYLLLRQQPRAWSGEDSVLVVLSLFIDLQGDNIGKESARGVLYDVLPLPLADFLSPRGSVEWDAPLFGGPLEPPPIPGPELFDLRNEPPGVPDTTPWAELEEKTVVGSNNWALAGNRTADGRAWIADDMHLDLRVPNTWYRACLDWPDEAGRTERHRAIGVTVPGGPGIVAGSNRLIAWGFTNTHADWSDLIQLDVPPEKPDHYQTPHGLRRFEQHTEVIRVKGARDIVLTVESTIWGPVVGMDHRGRKRALRWVAGDPDGVDLGVMNLARAHTLEEGLDLANRCGAPHQNVVVADTTGRIGWTIMGRIPRRRGFDGRLPQSWSDGSKEWDGYFPPSETPRLLDPPSGQIWTANARVCAGEDLDRLGDGGYDRGARAKQIRDRLLELHGARPEDLLAIALDDRALFLERWRALLLGALTPEAVARDPRRRALRSQVENWGGRASIDSVGYRMVVEFHLRTVQAVIAPLTARCRRADPSFRLLGLHTLETPAWSLVSARPAHLLDPAYASWDGLMLAVVDAMLASESPDGSSLAARTWGTLNTARIRHPLSGALGWLSRWLRLDMPAEPLPGGWSDMPRIQGPDFGASERLVVSPGAEERGFFHMPCGQSGHPLSPFYRKGHDDWVHGRPSPLLPGLPIATLVLKGSKA